MGQARSIDPTIGYDDSAQGNRPGAHVGTAGVVCKALPNFWDRSDVSDDGSMAGLPFDDTPAMVSRVGAALLAQECWPASLLRSRAWPAPRSTINRLARTVAGGWAFGFGLATS